MVPPLSRRRFVTATAQAGAVAALGDFAFLSGLPAAAADEPSKRAGIVPVEADIEPLVRLIEETPRDKILTAIAARVKGGTSYQELLAASLLVGVRGIKPRPVGFQFHAVLAIHSAHLAALAANDKDRWLPLFWAVDNFKVSQETNRTKNAGWTMSALDEAKVPSADKARKAFTDAMDNWDVDAADVAVAALARTAGAEEITELFWRYGMRDFRDIGHKAIFVANATRTLHTIGWRHAEPVLRSLAFALLDHEGENPAKRDGDPDRPYRENQKRLADIGPLSRPSRKVSPEATTDLLSALRTTSPSESSDKVAKMLKGDVHPQSIWDALFLTSAELLARQPGIVGLHCVTTVNALHQGYELSGNDDTRKLSMLQAAAFLSLFRQAMIARSGKLADLRLDALEKADAKTITVEEVFADAGKDRLSAARKALTLLEGGTTSAMALMATARRMIFARGRDSHDYKYSSALLEDYFHVSPRWRARFLASGLFQLRNAGDAENGLIGRTRAALGG